MAAQCDVEYLSKELNTRKDMIARFLHKHFKENINYTISKVVSDITREKLHGGHNIQYPKNVWSLLKIPII